MSIRHVIAAAALFSGAIANHDARAASGGTGVAVTTVTVTGLPTFAPDFTIAGTDGALYASYAADGEGPLPNGAVVQVTQDGASRILHQFDPATLNPVTGRYENVEGWGASGLLGNADGSLYGVSREGGPAGSGTFFRLAPDGTLVVLQAFDFSSFGYYENGNFGPVRAPDGSFYAIAIFDASKTLLYRVTDTGAYSTVCLWDSSTIPGGVLNGLTSLGDGTFALTDTGGIVKVDPADCTVTTIFATPYPGLPVLAGDGRIYAAGGPVIRVNPDGSGGTVIAPFNPITYQKYYPPSWGCDPIIGCHWTPGQWVTTNTAMSAQGSRALNAVVGSDGGVYVSTVSQGLNTIGADLRIGPDGTVTTLFSQPYDTNFGMPLNLLPDGRLARLVISNGGLPPQLTILDMHSALGTSISFSNASVKLWQATTLSWSSTGAQSCSLISDIPGVAAKSVASSGSKRVVLYNTGKRTPAQFTAGIQCKAADGSLSNAAAALSIQ